MSESSEFHIDKYNNDGVKTLFSVSGRNQLEQIAIADKKATMITAICVTLIFFIIAMLSIGTGSQGVPLFEKLEFAFPMGILLAFCSISAVCALLALKPKIVRSKKTESKSVLFFHNYYRMTIDEYKTKMHGLMDSPEKIYNHMLTDMYYNGLVLERKYALLGFAYSIFLAALVCSVTSYVIIAVF